MVPENLAQQYKKYDRLIGELHTKVYQEGYDINCQEIVDLRKKCALYGRKVLKSCKEYNISLTQLIMDTQRIKHF